MAVSARFENMNRIDGTIFPAHLSLYLGGVRQVDLEELTQAIGAVVSPFVGADGEATSLYTGKRGFIGLRCRADGAIGELHRRLVGVCAMQHRRSPVYRPHLLGRWGHLSAAEREGLEHYGASKVLDKFDAHFSVAQVKECDLPAAFELVQQCVTTPVTFRAPVVALVDIGHRNESWRVLHAWERPATVGSA